MKQCTKCNKKKGLSEFNNHKISNDGKRHECKNCQKKYNQKFRNNNQKHIKKYNRSYYKKNKQKIVARVVAYEKNKRKNNLEFRVCSSLRSRIRAALQGNTKSLATKQLIGCTPQFLKEYIEKQFINGMTWENYGYHGWHIDHIIPCSSFDMTDPKQQKKCFHYTNLQPLWAKDNLLKSNKTIYDQNG
jgi:hypothetical protein